MGYDTRPLLANDADYHFEWLRSAVTKECSISVKKWHGANVRSKVELVGILSHTGTLNGYYANENTMTYVRPICVI